MATIKFTGARIHKAQCDPGKQQTFIWDSTVQGLALRITASGSKAYVLESRFYGKTLRMTIGGTKAWSLADAQSEARRLQTLIEAGTDPRQAKAEKIAKAEAAKEQAKVEAMRNSILVQQAWDDYVTKNSPRWSRHHAIDHTKVSAPGRQPKKRGPGVTVQGVLYPLLQMRLIDVNPDTLAAWQASQGNRRTSRLCPVSDVLELVRRTYKLSIHHQPAGHHPDSTR